MLPELFCRASYAEVHFDVRVTGQRLSLPVNALLFRPDGTMAAVVGPDNRISLKKITIGRDFGNTLEVLEGIDPADRIVVNPPDSLEQERTRQYLARRMPQGTRSPSYSPAHQTLRIQTFSTGDRRSKHFPLLRLDCSNAGV